MHSSEIISKIELKANLLRQDIINMLCHSGSGHPGGSLSATDIVATLYFHVLKHDPQNPKDENRDRFVMSKGHAAPLLYAALAECGYFPKEELLKLRQTGALLQGHIDMHSVPGIDMSTGSLGQGLSVANGMAIAGKLNKKDYRVYALLGDGECQEGQVWEAAMTAAHYKLDNLIAFVDFNEHQIDGRVSDIKNIEPLDKKFESFNWKVFKCDGHSVEEILSAIEVAKLVKGAPSVIIARTVKGKGVSFMEEAPLNYHGKAPTKEERERAMAQLCKVVFKND